MDTARKEAAVYTFPDAAPKADVYELQYAAPKEAEVWAQLDAAERASNPVVSLAEQAKKCYIESVQKHLKDADFQPCCIDLGNLGEYIPNSKQLNHFVTDNGYCTYKQNLVVSVNKGKVTYYVIFSYESLYDPDIQFNSNLELSKDEMINSVADDLVFKIMSGTAYSSLRELVVAQRNDELIYQKLKDRFCLELDDAIEIDRKETVPESSVMNKDRIEKGHPASMGQLTPA